MTYYLGIDGGGTKTTCALGDESGVLAIATAGPSNVVRVGESRARESLHQCVRQVCDAAGITAAEIAHTCVGGAGAGRPELAALVGTMLGEMIGTPIDVVGDMHIALEAAFGAGPGVIVIAGTGSIAYGRDSRGTIARAGGWGFAISDEGSAHWIGRAAISAVLGAVDLTDGSPESLTLFHSQPYVAALMKAWGVTSVADLARAANAIPPPDFAALFPAVLANGSPEMALVLSRAGTELAQLAAIVIGRLFGNGELDSVPVAMTGSVFRHAEIVRQIFCNKLQEIDRQVAITPQIIEPVQGALLMARRAAATNSIRT